ncbi:hypothetical protein HYZ98_02560 [Candidatus Peregrinibacteria bacterium]|nr:hypothetical protein [Candidatus Peregrinibacteria bacterium]
MTGSPASVLASRTSSVGLPNTHHALAPTNKACRLYASFPSSLSSAKDTLPDGSVKEGLAPATTNKADSRSGVRCPLAAAKDTQEEVTPRLLPQHFQSRFLAEFLIPLILADSQGLPFHLYKPLL